MFGRNGGTHCDGAKNVTGAGDCEQEKETKTDAREGIEDRLDTYAINHVNKESEPEKKGESLKRNEGTTRIAGGGRLGFFDECRYLVILPVFGQLFSRCHQGDALCSRYGDYLGAEAVL